MSDIESKLADLKKAAVKQLESCGVNTIDGDRLDELVDRLRSMVDNLDATLVAAADDSELETVRRNFVEKTLGIADKERGMAAVKTVAERMSGVHQKSRVAFYYLLQDELV